jgi:hypothetical protein
MLSTAKEEEPLPIDLDAGAGGGEEPLSEDNLLSGGSVEVAAARGPGMQLLGRGRLWLVNSLLKGWFFKELVIMLRLSLPLVS